MSGEVPFSPQEEAWFKEGNEEAADKVAANLQAEGTQKEPVKKVSGETEKTPFDKGLTEEEKGFFDEGDKMNRPEANA